MLAIFILLGVLVVNIFFCSSLSKTLALIPKRSHVFPSWFAWLILIPVLGLVFEWMMLPFGIPNAIKHHLPQNSAALRSANKLFAIGLAYVIIVTLAAFFGKMGFFIGIVALILFILYWLEVVNARQCLGQLSAGYKG
tara:strand:+ start:68891 stop:69304 length:414 start_codon:yes stop_codon:yes gene_type:complete